MTSLLVLLEDKVQADFGAADLMAVRQRIMPHATDAPPVAVARQFLDALALVQRRAPAQVYGWAGESLVAPVLKEMPAVSRGHTSLRTLLLQLNQSVPQVMAGLLPESTCPEFWEDLLSGDAVRVGFDGPEEVAWVMEGAVRGLAAHFGERVDVTRGMAPPILPERRLVDVRVLPDRRASVRPNSPARGLSSAGLRG